ncbi:MAG: transglycosylase domain-containing protein [Thermaerobacter sp.]|nr:transglycosylase domain-containing protein [Thermaerobacter sp.]
MLLLFLLVTLAVAIDVGSTVVQAASNLPPVGDLVSTLAQGQGSTVYDLGGQPVAVFHGVSNRRPVPLSQVSQTMQQAIVAIEDHNFYHNPGFDFRSILRAALVDLIHQAPVQGASTITEQLAKDLYLGDQKTLVRKVREFIIGLELAHRYSKNQILAMYLNEVYYGQGANGIYAASKTYFNETPSQLTLAQASLLAGLPQAPSLYDPLVNYHLARQRQWLVLQAMVRYGDITATQAAAAYRTPLAFHPASPSPAKQPYPYPWYLDQVIHVLRQAGISMSQINNGGLKIYTALRPQVYDIAQQAVDQWMNKNFGPAQHPNPAHQAAAVVEDPKTGHIWAIIGGRVHLGIMPFNFATQASRSTGSAIKPLLDYTPALVKGYTQMSVIQDVPIFANTHGQSWWPANDNNLYRGYLDLRDALAISDNDVAVHLLNHIGIPYAVNFANQKFGLGISPAQAKQGLGIALGVNSNAYLMTQAYATFANGGVRMQPIIVTKVVNPKGQVVYQSQPHGTREISPQVAYIMTQMMQRVLTPHSLPAIGPGSLPTGFALGIGRPAAGKTGTNNNEADAWFVGFEPQAVCGVWEGDQFGEIAQPFTLDGQGPAYGDVAAGPIWRQIMTQLNHALQLPPRPFARPSGLVFVPRVSITSGQLASPYAPAQDVQGAWFIQGTQPTTTGSSHYPVKISANNPATLWQPGCGPYLTANFLHPESDWHAGVPRPWDSIYWAPTTTCTPNQPSGFPSTKPGKHLHRHPKH